MPCSGQLTGCILLRRFLSEEMRHPLAGILAFVFLISATAVAQSKCDGIHLKAASEKRTDSRESLPTISVAIENNSDAPVAIRRDKVGSSLSTERFKTNRWETVAGRCVGRGVGDASATPPKLSQEQAVKNALDEYVVLYPNESFVVRVKMEPANFSASDEAKAAPKGRYRVVFEYFDDLSDSAPVYRSTCKVSSNPLSITVN